MRVVALIVGSVLIVGPLALGDWLEDHRRRARLGREVAAARAELTLVQTPAALMRWMELSQKLEAK